MDYINVVKNAAAFIHEKYSENITVADIAAHVYFSPSYFSAVFRKLTGYTVKDYLLRYRLYMTARELRDTNKQMFTIAAQNGFATQQAYTKSFTQMYGIAPARFRQTKPRISKFPPKNLLADLNRDITADLRRIFENVRFVKKDAFFVAGIETDINYYSSDGTKSIEWLWARWFADKPTEIITGQIFDDLIYGITHDESIYDTAKYMIGLEVSTLENIPPGYMGRRFEACEYAVFDCTLDDITSGGFWNYFHTVFLREQGLTQPGAVNQASGSRYSHYPNIEVYHGCPSDMQIYAPVIKNIDL